MGNIGRIKDDGICLSCKGIIRAGFVSVVMQLVYRNNDEDNIELGFHTHCIEALKIPKQGTKDYDKEWQRVIQDIYSAYTSEMNINACKRDVIMDMIRSKGLAQIGVEIKYIKDDYMIMNSERFGHKINARQIRGV